jgi:3-oxoacyl-[acyl-carrier protein] reductase
MYVLKGRVGLVTGAGGGIGREIARRFAREGMTVAVLDRDRAAAETVAGEIDGLALSADASSPDEVRGAVEAVLASFRRIDVLVNNAGVAWMGPALEMPLAALQEMLRVNVEGVFIVSRSVLPHMIAQRSGSVVNLASWAGKTGNAFFAGYSASKFAVIGLTNPGLGARDGAARHPRQRDLSGDRRRHRDAYRDRGAAAALRAPRNRGAGEVNPDRPRFGA